MTKVELYNSIVDVFNKTGQGVPYFISVKIGTDVIDELIEENLVKLVTKKYNNLPDDVTICLTKGYCVEDDLEDNNLALTFIRIYKNIEIKDVIQDLDLMKQYVEWLEKNKEKLSEKIEKLVEPEKIENIIKSINNPEQINKTGLDRNVFLFLKNRKWYIDNDIVSKCLNELTEDNNSFIKQISIYNDMIRLKSNQQFKGIYDEEIQSDFKEIDYLKLSIIYSDKIRTWLLTKDLNIKIQDCL